jgi:hypothetical protein
MGFCGPATSEPEALPARNILSFQQRSIPERLECFFYIQSFGRRIQSQTGAQTSANIFHTLTGTVMRSLSTPGAKIFENKFIEKFFSRGDNCVRN